MHLIDIARLEERRRALCAATVADDVLEIAGGLSAEHGFGGLALRGRPGSWINYAVGFGLGFPGTDAPAAAGAGGATWPQVVDGNEIERVCAWYEAAGIEPRFEVSPLADLRVVRALAEAGCGVRDFTCTLYRVLEPGVPPDPLNRGVEGLTVRVIDPADAAKVRAYSVVAVAGFNADPTEEQLAFSDRAVRGPRTLALGGYLREAGGELLVAAGAMMLATPADGEPFATLGGCAALIGLTVLGPYRRRGIQRAMMAARMNLAAERGVRVATIGSRPGAATERNALRMGFALAYTKMIATRPRAGLVGMPG